MFKLSMMRVGFLTLTALLLSAPQLWAQEEDVDVIKVKDRVVVRVAGEEDHPHVAYLRHWGPHRGFIGVHLLDLTPELRAHFGVPEDVGIMVSKIAPESPAEEAGLQVGDIITSVDGEHVKRSFNLSRAVRKKDEGDIVDLEVWRDGRVETISLTVAERQRRVVELGRGVWAVPELEAIELPEIEAYRLDPEALESLGTRLHGLRRYFDSPEWQERLERIRSIEWEAVEEKMKEVQKRLEALERRLEEEESDD